MIHFFYSGIWPSYLKEHVILRLAGEVDGGNYVMSSLSPWAFTTVKVMEIPTSGYGSRSLNGF